MLLATPQAEATAFHLRAEGVPIFFVDTSTLTLQNTGNVPVAVTVWPGSASVPGQQTLAPMGSMTLPDSFELTVELDGGGTISDPTRLPVTPFDNVLLGFFPVHPRPARGDHCRE